MFGISDYSAFVAAIALFLIIPGPGNLALVTSAGQGGWVAGLAATLGIIVGDQVLLWLAVAGVAALLSAHPVAFATLQWSGAVYLAWLGWRMLNAEEGAAPLLQIHPGHYFRQSMGITLLNPKAIMFYMAFFPLFVDPAKHQGLITFAAMAITIAALTLIYGLIAVFLALRLAQQFQRRPQIGRWLEKFAGACLIAFGIKLALGK